MASTTADGPEDWSDASTSRPVSDVLLNVTGLVWRGMDLRAEVQENVGKAVGAIGLLVAAVVLLLTARSVLGAALAPWLAATGMDAGWAASMVGSGLALVGAVLSLKGQSGLELASLAPTRNARNVEQDARTGEARTHGR